MPALSSATDGRPARSILLTFMILLVSTCAGCGLLERHQNRKVPAYGTYDPASPRELNKVSLPSYVIEPPDELEISVRPESLDFLTRTVVVRQDGVVDLGFYGEAYVAGLTVREAELDLARQIAGAADQKEIKDPIQVSLRLVSGSKSKQYYVLGTVNAPGAFPITGNDTVLDAILAAGLKSHSLPEKAYLARPHPEGGPDRVLHIDWERIKMGDTATNYQLLPGDRVVVPGGRPPGLLKTLIGG
jgi:polysaccharide export outer membrane protein